MLKWLARIALSVALLAGLVLAGALWPAGADFDPAPLLAAAKPSRPTVSATTGASTRRPATR